MTPEDIGYRINGLVRVEYRTSSKISLSAIETSHSNLLYPLLSNQVHGKPLREPLIGVTALIDLKPVGLILSELGKIGTARIICWNVLPGYRKKGIGVSMLSRLEQALLEDDIHIVTHSIRSDLPAFQAVDAILTKRGWSLSEALRFYKVTRSSFNEPVWFDYVALRKNYSIFSWNKLLPAEKVQILESQKVNNWFPRELNPFQLESSIESINSLGLRFHDRVIGWMITHRVAPDVIQYTSLFVAREHRSHATAVPLIAESVRRHLSTNVSRAIFQVRSNNHKFLRFISRRLSPVLSSSAKCFQFKKDL